VSAELLGYFPELLVAQLVLVLAERQEGHQEHQQDPDGEEQLSGGLDSQKEGHGGDGSGVARVGDARSMNEARSGPYRSA
jgi:hypothetical protein